MHIPSIPMAIRAGVVWAGHEALPGVVLGISLAGSVDSGLDILPSLPMSHRAVLFVGHALDGRWP